MSHHVMMSIGEEKSDEHNLDNRKHGGPEQEDMDKGMLVMLWHRQFDGSAQRSLSLGSTGREMMAVQVLSFLCRAPMQCVSLFPELRVCM